MTEKDRLLDHIAKCEQKAEKGKFTRVSSGFYFSRDNLGNIVQVTRLTEGNYKDWWIVEYDDGSISDPVSTLKQAKIETLAYIASY